MDSPRPAAARAALSGPARGLLGRAGLLVLLAAAGCVGVRLGPADFERQPASTAELDAARAEVVARVNAARRRAGRAPVAAHPALERAAQRHAADMAARGFYSHDNPEGRSPRDRAGRAGYGPARLIGENIARGARSPEEAVELWLDSRSHRRILLEASFSETGVGIAAGRHRGQTRLYWVQLFGAPR